MHTRAASKLAVRSHPAAQAGFTLTEFLITSSIFILVVGGVLSAHIFGLKLIGFTQACTETSDDDRRLRQRLTTEISTAKYWEIGSGSASTFTEISPNRLQIANALQIYPVPGSTQYVRYYLNTSTDTLYRITNNAAAPEMVAKPVINYNVFTTEDSSGNVLSNRVQAGVLGIALQFQDAAKKSWGFSGDSLTHWLRLKYTVRAGD